MVIVCPQCGKRNRVPDLPEPTTTYRCANCRKRLVASDTRGKTVVDHRRVVRERQTTGATIAGAVLLCLTVVGLVALAGLWVTDKVSFDSRESLPIAMYPRDILKEPAREVAQVGLEEMHLADLMISTMEKADGVGLAAPQVGIGRRIAVVRLHRPSTEAEIVVMFNPEIMEREGEASGREGCLSVAGTRINTVEITRSERIVVKYWTLEGEEVIREESGWNARIIQHEIDHLDGTLIVDYAGACNITPEIIAALGIVAITAFCKMRFVRTSIVRVICGKE